MQLGKHEANKQVPPIHYNLVADTNDASTVRKTTRWYCRGVPLQPVWPTAIVPLLLSTCAINQSINQPTNQPTNQHHHIYVANHLSPTRTTSVRRQTPLGGTAKVCRSNLSLQHYCPPVTNQLTNQHGHVGVANHLVAETKDVSTARNTSRWYCQGVSFKPAPVVLPFILVVLLGVVIVEPNQGVSWKHKASHANDAKGPGRSPAERPTLATSLRKPLR